MEKWGLLISILFLFVSCSERKNNTQDEMNKIELKQGETFTIELRQNGSIGFSNCWINETKCQNVQLISSQYISSHEEKEGCIGCGGTDYWTFKAIKLGIDTIKIKQCPTVIEQKSCIQFHEDSMNYKKMTNYTSAVDRTIIVQVLK